MGSPWGSGQTCGCTHRVYPGFHPLNEEKCPLVFHQDNYLESKIKFVIENNLYSIELNRTRFLYPLHIYECPYELEFEFV